MKKYEITDAELEIMKVLWKNEELTLNEIVEILSKKEKKNKSTIKTLLYRLIEKGSVKSIAKNIVNYTKQAQSFFSKNNASGYLLREGVIKIAGAPGGIFNTDGLIRSFWYIL